MIIQSCICDYLCMCCFVIVYTVCLRFSAKWHEIHHWLIQIFKIIWMCFTACNLHTTNTNNNHNSWVNVLFEILLTHQQPNHNPHLLCDSNHKTVWLICLIHSVIMVMITESMSTYKTVNILLTPNIRVVAEPYCIFLSGRMILILIDESGNRITRTC